MTGETVWLSLNQLADLFVSHEDAVPKAEIEFDRFRQSQAVLPQPVDYHFEQTLNELKRIKPKKPLPREKKPKPPCPREEA